MAARRPTTTKRRTRARASVLDEAARQPLATTNGSQRRGGPDRGPEDVQALHRRRFPTHRIGEGLRGLRCPRGAPRQCQPRHAQGHPRRRSGSARRPAGLGGEDGVQPLPDPLPHRRADGGTARAVRRGGRQPPRASRDRGRPASSMRRSTGGSGTRAGRTSTRRSSGRSTRSPGATSTSASPSRRASSGSSPRRRHRSWDWSAASRRSSSAAMRPWSSHPSRARCRP